MMMALNNTYSYTREQLLALRPERTSSVNKVSYSTHRTLNEYGICSDNSTRRGCRGGKFQHLAPISRVIDDSTIKNKLNLSMWNARSVGNKTDLLYEYVIEHDIDVLCLTETWLHPEDSTVIGELTPPCYRFINIPRDSEDDHHGGIGILYQSQLHLGLYTDNQLPKFDTFEFAVVSNTSRTFTIVTVYRPPPSKKNKLKVSSFLNDFEEFLSFVNLLPGKIILLGDFNVHYDLPSKWDVKRFSTTLESADFMQHIVGPTHRCGHTLDLFITRQNNPLLKRYVIDRLNFPKDHYMINCVIDFPKPSAESVTYTMRNYRQIDHDAFSKDLESKMCDIALEKYANVNDLLTDYNQGCQNVLDQHAPLSTKTRLVRNRPSWYDDDVADARRERRRHERKWRKNGTDANRDQYLKSKLNVKEKIITAKKVYYSDKLNTCSAKDLNKTVNELLNKNERALPDTEHPADLADDFGNFFVGKVSKIRDEVDNMSSGDNSTGSLDYIESPPVKHQFPAFRKVADDELLDIINKCPNKSCALDPMPTWLVKQHMDVLLPTVSRIVNTSLQDGEFPDDFHQSIITPVLKKPSLNQNELKNYRPVANLQFTSKVLEKCAASQVIEHSDTHNLSEPLQSAYRTMHSTETALACVQNDILRALDNQKAVLLLMLDLSAAFDTVDHEIMLQRLRDDFGVSGSAHDWYKSYLANRSFQVLVSGEYSKVFNLKYGLPQGSVTGPLGFVYYTHVVGRILRHHGVKYHIYADDIQIYLEVDPKIPGDVQCALFKLMKCVEDIQRWMIENKLKLNEDKTEFFIASSKHHWKKLNNTSLLLGDVQIFPSSSVRNLGVMFDQEMSMSNHVTQLSKSVNWMVRNLYRIRQYIDSDTCHNTVRATIMSRLDYCNVLLNGITQKDMKRLQKLQNKCAGLITMTPKYDHITPVLKKLHWLPVEERVVFKTLVYVYKSLHGLSPKYIQNCLTVNDPPEEAIRTRSADNISFLVPRFWKGAGERAFSVAAPRLWNSLPVNIRKAPSLQSFKSILKTHLFRNHFFQ